MKKSVDFTNGIRGKHAGMNLKVVGAVKTLWAICVTKKDKNLIPFKLYSIDTFSRSDQVRLKNEKGEKVYLPKEWFAPIVLPKKTLGLLENTA